MAHATNSHRRPWIGMQQSQLAKQWDQVLPCWKPMPSNKQFGARWRNMCGSVYTGIPTTSRNGFGSTDHGLLTLTGIQENLTTTVRSVEWCILILIKGNGTMGPAVKLCITFVKLTVRGLYKSVKNDAIGHFTFYVCLLFKLSFW